MPSHTKADFYREIEKRANKIRLDGETPAQAFSRYATKLDEGRLLFFRA